MTRELEEERREEERREIRREGKEREIGIANETQRWRGERKRGVDSDKVEERERERVMGGDRGRY